MAVPKKSVSSKPLSSLQKEKKSCSKCGQEKLLTDYYRHKLGKDGHKTQCKECEGLYARRVYDEARATGAVYVKAKADTTRSGNLRRMFGITPEQYDQLLEGQNHSCAVCHRHASEFKKRFAVDHAHTRSKYVEAGMIRGLLCFNCNHLMIGRNTDADLFEAAAAYLKQHVGWRVPEDKIKPKRTRRKRKKIIV